MLGRDYSAAPTCATCHMGSYLTPEGVVRGNNHDVWKTGMTPAEVEAMRKAYQERYQQKN